MSMGIKKLLPIFLIAFIMSCKDKKTDAIAKWSPEYKNIVRSTMMKSLSLDKDYSTSEMNKICDCIVDKYEEFYPGGIKHKIPIDTLNIITKICSPRNR